MTARFKKRRSIFQEMFFLAFTVLNNSKLSHQAIRIEPLQALFSVPLDATQITRCDVQTLYPQARLRQNDHLWSVPRMWDVLWEQLLQLSPRMPRRRQDGQDSVSLQDKGRWEWRGRQGQVGSLEKKRDSKTVDALLLQEETLHRRDEPLQVARDDIERGKTSGVESANKAAS